MLKTGFYISTNYSYELHQGLSPYEYTSGDKSKWINNGKYFNIWINQENDNNYYICIQYGLNTEEFASIKFLWYRLNIINKVLKNNVYNITLRYEFIQYRVRLTDFAQGGYNVHNTLDVGGTKIYDLNYNTAEEFNNENKIVKEITVKLNEQEQLTNRELLHFVFNYNNVIPTVEFFAGVFLKNGFQSKYYPGKFRNNILLNNKLIKNRVKTLSKDIQNNQNKIDTGIYRYRLNNNQYQIPKRW